MQGITIVNNAIGGRSARSFTDEGRFTSIINAVVSGDYVIIEFGHNDGGSLSPTDNGRSACVGAGSETCVSPTGAIVQTYPTYLTVSVEHQPEFTYWELSCYGEHFIDGQVNCAWLLY